ncbi:MAG: hypothetical protein KDK36_17020, partial [Leptospiraceae bacterium]|nr:hypothetical protein [Leptospiraceae bacterium]
IIQGNYINLQRIYTTKSYKIVEGLIENFHPMPKSGHDKESFSVKGVLFEYSDYEISGFFNNTASHGGPFKTNGQQVKITYFPTKRGNAIIKVELKDETD